MIDYIDSVKNTLKQESEAISNLIEALDAASITKAVEVLSECKGRIVLAGCGTSGAAGRKIAHTFSCVECPAFFLEPSDALHGGMGAVQSGDVVILLSKGGISAELNNLIEPAKKKGAYIIGVTENMESRLAKESNLCIRVAVAKEPDPFNMLATSSILATIAMFDAIIIAIMQKKNYTREQFSVIHPMGAVGERLLNNLA